MAHVLNVPRRDSSRRPLSLNIQIGNHQVGSHTANAFEALGLTVVAASQKYESRTNRSQLGKQPREIEIRCDNHPLLSNTGREDQFVGRAIHRQFARMNGVVPERS